MPTVKCERTSCIHRSEGRCSLHYICLELDKDGTMVRCGSYKADTEYEEALTLAGRNPRLSAEREA